ncbi:hypothetical protein DAMA08_004040 [Martiniozyma asiatica (nom. inval.)]|nr:hypothetical protein DAMA08_004040 [Martiniozyma asiatica]
MSSEINKEFLVQRLATSKETIPQFINSDIFEASAIENPIKELPKLSTLIHSHITKIGLVFKPPIKETTYKACNEQINELMKTITMLCSLNKQINKNNDGNGTYSNLFVCELKHTVEDLLKFISLLFGEISQNLEIENESDEESGRLISIGRVWEICQTLEKIGNGGSSGVLRLKIKENNKLVIDALEELTEWIENPVNNEDVDPFGFESESELESDDDNAFTNDANPPVAGETENEKISVDEELINFAKKWKQKIQLVKLLLSSLDKSIPVFKLTSEFASKIDIINEKTLKLCENVDDIVASIVWDGDVETAQEAGNELSLVVKYICQLVIKLNEKDDKKVRWLETWKTKFLEV